MTKKFTIFFFCGFIVKKAEQKLDKKKLPYWTATIIFLYMCSETLQCFIVWLYYNKTNSVNRIVFSYRTQHF